MNWQDRMEELADEMAAEFLNEVSCEGFGEHMDFVRQVRGVDISLPDNQDDAARVVAEQYCNAVEELSSRLAWALRDQVKAALWPDTEYRTSGGSHGSGGWINNLPL